MKFFEIRFGLFKLLEIPWDPIKSFEILWKLLKSLEIPWNASESLKLLQMFEIFWIIFYLFIFYLSLKSFEVTYFNIFETP